MGDAEYTTSHAYCLKATLHPPNAGVQYLGAEITVEIGMNIPFRIISARDEHRLRSGVGWRSTGAELAI